MSKQNARVRPKPAPAPLPPTGEKTKGSVTVRRVAIAVVIILIVLALKLMADVNRGEHVKIFGLEFNEPEPDEIQAATPATEFQQRHLADIDVQNMVAQAPDRTSPIIIATIGDADNETRALQEEVAAKFAALGYTNIIKNAGGFTGKHKPGKIDLVKTSKGLQVNIYPQGGIEQL